MVVGRRGVGLLRVAGGSEVLQKRLEAVLAEQIGGDEPLLDEEPAEDDAGEEPDEEERLLLLGVAVLREADCAVVDQMVRPEIPVGDLAVEIVGEGVGAEALLPGGMEGDEVVNAEVGREIGQGEIVEDLDVGSDGVGEGDILDEGDLSRTSRD